MLIDQPTEVKDIKRYRAQSVGVCIPYKIADGLHYLWDYRRKSITNILLSDALTNGLSVERNCSYNIECMVLFKALI